MGHHLLANLRSHVFFRAARRGLTLVAALTPSMGLAAPATFSPSHTTSSLKKMSLEDLMNLEVSTVSRKEERWWTAAGAIDVITNEEMRRAGVQNLPDALRLVTGVHVGQSSTRSWAISTRGFNILADNKISVVMDGRSLFTPFFSGVQWDAQHTLLEDVDRIEVVRGPAGSLWGAFAVNGFIQIVTKPAWETQGLLVAAATGTENPGSFSVRYGGAIGDGVYYRAYATYFQTRWTHASGGGRTRPDTDFFQSGFRLDSRRVADTTLTLQGDVYTNKGLRLDDVRQTDVSGGNILGRWSRVFSSDADAQVEGYFDQTGRNIAQFFQEDRRTFSVNGKYHIQLGRHNLLFGADALTSRDHIPPLSQSIFEPAERTTHTISGYAQNTMTLVPDRATLTIGFKGEHNSFSGYELQPTIRFAWTPSVRTTGWVALSRAVRTPVRIDHDFVSRRGSRTLFQATDQFRSEKVVAYELGLRRQLADNLTADLATFINRYDDLRSTERAGADPVPSTFKNTVNAHSEGVELAVMYQPSTRFFFKGNYRYLYLGFSRDPGSGDATGSSGQGNDPRHLATLTGYVNLRRNLEFNATLRYVSSLPNPATPAYTALDLRLGWNPASRWEVALIARNLLDHRHREFITTNSLNEEVSRSVLLKVTYRR